MVDKFTWIFILLIINTVMLAIVVVDKPLIQVIERDGICENKVEGWGYTTEELISLYPDNCYLPSNCFRNQSEYLKQFPNSTQPNNLCLYMINCVQYSEFMRSSNDSN